MTWRSNRDHWSPTHVSLKEQKILPQAPTNLKVSLSFPPSGQGVLRVSSGHLEISRANSGTAPSILLAFERLPVVIYNLHHLRVEVTRFCGSRVTVAKAGSASTSCLALLVLDLQSSRSIHSPVCGMHEVLRDPSIGYKHAWPSTVKMCVASKVDSKADLFDQMLRRPRVSIRSAQVRPSSLDKSKLVILDICGDRRNH